MNERHALLIYSTVVGCSLLSFQFLINLGRMEDNQLECMAGWDPKDEVA